MRRHGGVINKRGDRKTIGKGNDKEGKNERSEKPKKKIKRKDFEIMRMKIRMRIRVRIKPDRKKGIACQNKRKEGQTG